MIEQDEAPCDPEPLEVPYTDECFDLLPNIDYDRTPNQEFSKEEHGEAMEDMQMDSDLPVISATTNGFNLLQSLTDEGKKDFVYVPLGEKELEQQNEDFDRDHYTQMIAD